MDNMKTNREFIREFNTLKMHILERNYAGIFSAMYIITELPDEYELLWLYLFDNTPHQMEENQLIFAKLWAGEIGFDEEEDQYIVWFKGSEVEGEWATFVFYGQDKGRVYSQYKSKKSVKGSKSCWLGEIEAFKLFNTGMFEIEKVEQ